jgi:hypothetical protein
MEAEYISVSGTSQEFICEKFKCTTKTASDTPEMKPGEFYKSFVDQFPNCELIISQVKAKFSLSKRLNKDKSNFLEIKPKKLHVYTSYIILIPDKIFHVVRWM